MDEQLTMSLIYKRNSNGPKIELCGTPQVIYENDDDTPFMLTYCCLSCKYFQTISKVNPKCHNTVIYVKEYGGSKYRKPFDRSKETPIEYCFWSIAKLMHSYMFKMAIYVE